MSSNDLVTLAETKGLLHFEQDDASHDVRVSALIGAASVSVLRFIKSTGGEYRDSNGDVVPGNVPDDIKVATAMLVGILDSSPDENKDKIFTSDYLPAPVEAILHSRREPTLA